MKIRAALSLGLFLLAAIIVIGGRLEAGAAQTAGRGTIKGHTRLTGKLPGNPIIRMGMDPMCAKINAGKRVVQESVVASADGSLSNVFVTLDGAFPQTPVPTQPVVIDQRGCIYLPRMVGARVGQMLEVKNSDPLLHNVHSLTSRGNSFNVGQPQAGIVYRYRLKDEELMLRIKCDVHSWMTAYVGIVSHSYFAVSGDAGAFEIANVPPGTHTVRTWHERYGVLTQTVRVRAGVTTTVEFAYTDTEKPPTAGLRDLAVPATALAAH